MNRPEIIQYLVNYDLELLSPQDMGQILQDGCEGYNNMDNATLWDLYINTNPERNHYVNR